MDQVTRQMLGKIKLEIEKLQHDITKLQHMEQSIIEQFVNSSNGTRMAAEKSVHGSRRTRTAVTATNETPRKIAIQEWLKKHGPASRAEIINGTKLPGGTVGAYLSTEKQLFENRDGRWNAR